MPKMTDAEQAAFLQKPGILMRIGTTCADGRPLVTPIWFVCEDGAIWFTPRRASAWFANLRRDPRVSLCIDDQEHPYCKVIVDGVAELVHDLGEDDAWRDRYRRIALRYVPPDGAEAYIQNTIDQQRGLYRVVLAGADVRSWRMPVAGEDGTGIWAQHYYAPGTKFARKG